MNGFDVRIHSMRRRRDRRRQFEIRWHAAGRDRSKSFITRGLADSYRAELVRAARQGREFDAATGEPASWILPDRPVVTLACRGRADFTRMPRSNNHPYADGAPQAGPRPSSRRSGSQTLNYPSSQPQQISAHAGGTRSVLESAAAIARSADARTAVMHGNALFDLARWRRLTGSSVTRYSWRIRGEVSGLELYRLVTSIVRLICGGSLRLSAGDSML
jgi:hypothetical protein